jgi:hypothetical protein
MRDRVLLKLISFVIPRQAFSAQSKTQTAVSGCCHIRLSITELGSQAQKSLWMRRRYTIPPLGDERSSCGITLQVVRHWVLRFNAHGADCLLDHKGSSRRL